MTSPADHVDVAAYVLGALDDADSAAFERHLAGCPRCQAELDELSGLPALLDQVKGSGLLADLLAPDEQLPAPRSGGNGRHAPAHVGFPDLADFADFGQVPQLPPTPPRAEDKVLRGVMVDIADARRKRRRTGLLAAAAAAVLIVAGPLITIAATGGFSPQEGSNTTQAVGEVHQVSNPANNVSAKISLAAQDDGTAISFDLSGVKGPLNCTLYAVNKDGEKYAVSSWLVNDAGYGVPGSPTPLHVSGTAAVVRSDLKELQFATANGPDILDVPL